MSKKIIVLGAGLVGKTMAIDIDEFGGVSLAAGDRTQENSADRTLVERLQAGDEAAFENFVGQYSSDIYGLLLRITSDPDEAADLTQETFIQAFRGIAKFRGEADLRTWLYRIAVNRSRNSFRWWKRRRRDKAVSIDATIADTELTVGDTLADTGRGPEGDLIARERESRLLTALAGLKPIYRTMVTLADIHGLSYEECAEATGENIGTVKSRLARGREELRKRLKDI